MAKTQFEVTLRAIHRLLRSVRETYWAEWIREDIGLWRSEQSTTHHLRAYGGMGSLNDVCLCRENGHDIQFDREPWANTAFEWLKSACYQFAREPQRTWSKDHLWQLIGRHDASLAAFVGGSSAPVSYRGLSENFPEFTGIRCLVCGYSEATEHGLEAFLADIFVPAAMFRAIVRSQLDRFVDVILTSELRGVKQTRRELRAALKTSRIVVQQKFERLEACPVCNAKDLAGYSWIFRLDRTPPFAPSRNNLPMRRKKPRRR